MSGRKTSKEPDAIMSDLVLYLAPNSFIY